MFITKAKVVAACVAAALFTGTGAVVVTQIALAADKPGKVKPDKDPNAFAGKKVDKSDYVKPDATGPILEVSADRSTFTMQTSKGSKEAPGQTTTVPMSPETPVTFSQIGPGGDVVAVGYTATVWFEAGSKNKPARVAFGGLQNSKDVNGPPIAQGKITAVSPDGRQITVEEAAKPPQNKGDVVVPASHESNVTPDTKIILSNVTADAASLQPGYSASVWIEAGARDSAAIVRASGLEGLSMKGQIKEGDADVVGNVVAVAVDGKAITVEEKPVTKQGPAPRTDVQIAPETKLIFNNVAPGTARPAEGYRAVVWRDADKPKVARAIHFDALPPEKKGPTLSSTVVGVSPDGKSITVEVPSKVKGEGPEERQIDVSEARLVFNNVRPGGAKVTQGYGIQVYTDPQSPNVALMAVFQAPKD